MQTNNTDLVSRLARLGVLAAAAFPPQGWVAETLGLAADLWFYLTFGSTLLVRPAILFMHAKSLFTKHETGIFTAQFLAIGALSFALSGYGGGPHSWSGILASVLFLLVYLYVAINDIYGVVKCLLK